MKIAIITSRYPSLGNPYNHMFVHMRSKEFVRQGEKVEVFVPGKETNEYTFEGISVNHMPSKDMIQYLSNYDILYLHLLHIYPFMKQDGWPIYKAIMQKKYLFAIYIHGSEAAYFKDRFFGKRHQLRDIFSWFRKDLYHMPRIKKFLSGSSTGVIITPSVWMKKEINYTFNNDNIYVVPNGIDVDLFQFKSIGSGKNLITVRPLGDKVYDIESTIEVLSLLPEKYTLDIYGKGRFKNHYNNLIIAKGLSNRVNIIDEFIERNNIPNLFYNYNCFLSTTKLDTQGVTMLEAMSSGLLTASINNSSKEEFISDMKTGILGNNPDELARKILAVTSDKELFENITRKGRESMEKIDIKVTCKQELKILKDIAKR